MAKSSDTSLQFLVEVEQNNNQTLYENSSINEFEQRECAPLYLSLEDKSDLSNCDSIKMPEFFTELHANKTEIANLQTTDSKSFDCGVHDSENNLIENSKLIDLSSISLDRSDCGIIIPNLENECNGVQLKEEEFHDAVQFFKDPASLTFLENVCTSSNDPDSVISRSSLYRNFDPLHAKFNSQSALKSELQEIAESELQEDDGEVDSAHSVNNKHLENALLGESLENVLISFESPACNKNESMLKTDLPKDPPKLYTEEELQQALKIQELSMQEVFLKSQHNLELDGTKKKQEYESTTQKFGVLCFTLHEMVKELVAISSILLEKEKSLNETVESTLKENSKLKEDLKTSVEDFQSIENTFSNLHKRYEQCKDMLKVYTQNEDNLKQQLESMKSQLTEQEEMYKVLQSRTQETLDRAHTEVSMAKKAGDSQIAVLNAQLKKAELKISSLESDVKHVKIENAKLSNICDELMAKVSET